MYRLHYLTLRYVPLRYVTLQMHRPCQNHCCWQVCLIQDCFCVLLCVAGFLSCSVCMFPSAAILSYPLWWLSYLDTFCKPVSVKDFKSGWWRPVEQSSRLSQSHRESHLDGWFCLHGPLCREPVPFGSDCHTLTSCHAGWFGDRQWFRGKLCIQSIKERPQQR